MILLFFAYSRLWIKTDSVLYKIARQPLLFASNCTLDSPAQVYGKISVEGEPLHSYRSNIPCVFYHYIIEEYVSDGESSSWKIVANYSNSLPFFVNDESGAVKIILKNIDSDFGKFSLKKDAQIGLASGLLDFDKNEVDAVKLDYRKKDSFLGNTVTLNIFFLLINLFL